MELAFLSELYNELRSYRDKEFQTFLFTFPIIGAGILTELRSWLIVIVLWLFGITVLFYVWNNHKRMMKIKRTIVKIQHKLGINELSSVKDNLNPEDWVVKPWYKHLGTMIYSVLIVAEMIALMLVQFVWVVLQKAANPALNLDVIRQWFLM